MQVLILLGISLDSALSQTSLPTASRDATIEEVPVVATALGRIDSYLKEESTLGRRRVELLSLITAREMNLTYAWSVHEPAALQFGLEPEIIDVIRHNRPAVELSRDDALLIDFGRQLYRNRHVASHTFAALVDELGRHASFDAIMALTYPAMLGLLERAVDRQPPADWDPGDLPAIADVGTPSGRPGDFLALGPRPPLPDDVYEDSYYRFPLLRRDELDAPTREIFDRVVGVDRTATPRGPVGMTFNSPVFVEPVQQINTALRPDGSLGTRQAEIVITATGREMNSQYQWIVHGAEGARAGAGERMLSHGLVDFRLAMAYNSDNESARGKSACNDEISWHLAVRQRSWRVLAHRLRMAPPRAPTRASYVFIRHRTASRTSSIS